MMKRAFVVAAAVLCVLISFGHADGRRADEISYCCGSTTVTPGTPITVNFNTAQGDGRAIHLRVYRISIEDAVAIERRDATGQTADVLGTLIWEGDARGRDRGWSREVSVGPFPIGLYVVQGSIGSASDGVLANVSTLGMMSIAGTGQSAVWAVDLRTFRAHTGPTTLEIAGKNDSKYVRCNFDGVAMVRGSIPHDPVYVAHTADGSVDIERFGDDSQGSAAPRIVQFVQTDRPVYRPGQTVYYRAILRSGFEDAYRIPSGKHRVQIFNQDGTPIFDATAAPSRFGTLSGEVKLPSYGLGTYALKIDGEDAKTFYVEAYKKPEYVMDVRPGADAVVAGEDALVKVHAAYLFGRPAAGMHVTYEANPQWYTFFGYTPYAGYYNVARSGNLPESSGSVVTDANGDAVVRARTGHVSGPYTLNFRLQARDDSGRTVESDTSLIVYPAAVRLTLTPDEWFAKSGDDVWFALASTDIHGKPAPHVQVRLRFARYVWDKRDGQYKEAGMQTLPAVTDSSGHAKIRWHAGEGGTYHILAQTNDARGNLESETQYLWVFGQDDSWFAPVEQPVLVPQHQTLAPGERPRVLVRMPAPGRDVALAVATDRLVSVHVVHVAGYTASIAFDAPRNATVFDVYAMLPTESGVSTANVEFARKPALKQLHIALRSDKKKYEPGDTATFDVLVTDAHGRRVKTELSLGIVDDAIYAVQDGDHANAVDQFYGRPSYVNAEAEWYRPNYVPPMMGSEEGVPQGTVSHAKRSIARVASRAARSLVKPGTIDDVYSVQGVKIRTNFQDTAYWTPSTITDANGRARVTFTWPDNLTTWRTSALGVTTDTDIGQGQAETLVTKAFLVRLEMPRFLRKGDRSTIVGIAQGKPDQPAVRLSLMPDAVDPRSELVHLNAADSASASWPFDAGDVLGDRTLTLLGSDSLRKDAMQLTLPIESDGAAEHVRDAGNAAGESAFPVSLPPGYDAGTLQVTLTPSIAAQLLENVRMLDVYPYYCTEQTMSAALPAIFVDRLFRRSGLQMPTDVSPPQVVEHAIERLSELQHEDGSWGWWETDAAHPFMTAYAVYGLAEFKHAGYGGLDGMLARGIDSLAAQLETSNTDTLRFWGGAQAGSEWNTRAFMLFAMADADTSRVDRDLLAQTLSHAGVLNSYALAVLGLAYHELGEDAAAKRILEMLNSRAVSRGPYTYWTGDTWHYAWEDDPIETTAYALRLNAAIEPDSQITGRAVAFLRSEQRGSWWYTTKDTAAAVYAIAQAQRPSQEEFHPNETVSVLVGDRTIKTLHVTSPLLSASDAEVDVPASMLRDGTSVRIVRSGTGSLYWASDFTRYAPWSVHDVRDRNRSLFARLFPPAPPLKIERRYRVDHAGPWRVGDEVHVDVTVSANEDVQYVAIEDPFPAGVEYAPVQGQAGSANWSGIQFFDDRAVFFADTLYRAWPLRLSYNLRVTTAGAYAAPPPIAYAMYGPPVSATGSGENVLVRQ